MSSILNESSFKRKKARASRSRGYINGFPRLKFPSFSNPFFPHHSQVDRCRDVKLILAGRKGVGETLNILVHRRSGRRFIIRRTEKRILSLPFPFSFTNAYRVPRNGPRGSIHPSRGTNYLPTRHPNRYSLLEKETFHLSRCRRFLNVSPKRAHLPPILPTFHSNLTSRAGT